MSLTYTSYDPDLADVEKLERELHLLYGKEEGETTTTTTSTSSSSTQANKVGEQVKDTAKKVVAAYGELQTKIINAIIDYIVKLVDIASYEGRMTKNKETHLKECTATSSSLKTALEESAKNKVTIAVKFNMLELKNLVNSDNKSMSNGAEVLAKVEEFIQAYIKSIDKGDVAELDAKKEEVKKLIAEMEDPELAKLRGSIKSQEDVLLVDKGVVTEHGRALQEIASEVTTKKLVETITSSVTKAKSLKGLLDTIKGKVKNGTGADKSSDPKTLQTAQSAVLKLIHKSLKAVVSLPSSCYQAITKSAKTVIDNSSKGNQGEAPKKEEETKPAGESYMYDTLDMSDIDKEFAELELEYKRLTIHTEPTEPIPGFEMLYVPLPSDERIGLSVGTEGILDFIGRIFSAIFNFIAKLFGGGSSGGGGSSSSSSDSKIVKPEVLEKSKKELVQVIEKVDTVRTEFKKETSKMIQNWNQETTKSRHDALLAERKKSVEDSVAEVEEMFRKNPFKTNYNLENIAKILTIFSDENKSYSDKNYELSGSISALAVRMREERENKDYSKLDPKEFKTILNELSKEKGKIDEIVKELDKFKSNPEIEKYRKELRVPELYPLTGEGGKILPEFKDKVWESYEKAIRTAFYLEGNKKKLVERINIYLQRLEKQSELFFPHAIKQVGKSKKGGALIRKFQQAVFNTVVAVKKSFEITMVRPNKELIIVRNLYANLIRREKQYLGKLESEKKKAIEIANQVQDLYETAIHKKKITEDVQ